MYATSKMIDLRIFFKKSLILLIVRFYPEK